MGKAQRKDNEFKIKPKISVITPASRGVKCLSNLFRDFKNQTVPKSEFEHVVVYDGTIPADVQKLADEYKKLYNLRLVSIKKDMGDMRIAPGTRPRNYGVSIAKGEYCCFADDDDRFKDAYCESFLSNMGDKVVACVQMSCQKSRMYLDGSKDEWVLIPEIGLPHFPLICHIGTPCFCVPREWALAEPWRHEPEHDYRFIKRICERFHPEVRIIGGMSVDVDGLVLRGLRDWVSNPPFYRE